MLMHDKMHFSYVNEILDAADYEYSISLKPYENYKMSFQSLFEFVNFYNSFLLMFYICSIQ